MTNRIHTTNAYSRRSTTNCYRIISPHHKTANLDQVFKELVLSHNYVR